MGTGCSLCCQKCAQAICCCSPCGKPKRNKATSPITKLLRSVGTLTVPILVDGPAPLPPPAPAPPPPPPPPPPQPSDMGAFTIPIIIKKRIDLSYLDIEEQNVHFEDIINEDILLKIDEKKIASHVKATSTTKLHHKARQESPDWNEKFFLNGKPSDVVTGVKSQIHGCFNSSISEDFDINFAILHEINTETAKISQDRTSRIAQREKSFIDQFTAHRDSLLKSSGEEARSYVNQYEDAYRRLIEEFIKRLEIEISKHLDYLHKEMEDEKQAMFQAINSKITRVTKAADKARDDFHQLLQAAAAYKRQEIINKIDTISKDKKRQPLGYEHLRTLSLQVYSTVGEKKDGQGCDNIFGRDKFIKEIDNAKPDQPKEKRIVYSQSDIIRQQQSRKKDEKN